MAGLDKLIRRFGTLIKLIIPYEKYVANGWEQMTRQLLTAYDDLSASPGSFGKMYQMFDDGDFDYKKKLAPYIRDKQMKAFISLKDIGYTHEDEFTPILMRGEVNTWSVVWAYSFWGRRYSENSDNIPHLVAALKILRDELYAPKAKPPKANKNLPPIEPYLTSDIRPKEQIYPWKLYTDRVIFLEHDGYEYDYLIVEKNGKQHWLLHQLSDDTVLNRGDVIDLTWDMEILYEPDDEGNNIRVKFTEFAHSVRIVEASVTTQFANKYEGVLEIECEDEDAIDEETKSKLLDKLLGYLLESNQSEITEALEIFSEKSGRLRIDVLHCDDWNDPRLGAIHGYGICLSLSRGEFAKFNGKDEEIFYGIMCFVYNPDTDTLYIDVEVALG
jgi:hypothetical protein